MISSYSDGDVFHKTILNHLTVVFILERGWLHIRDVDCVKDLPHTHIILTQLWKACIWKTQGGFTDRPIKDSGIGQCFRRVAENGARGGFYLHERSNELGA